MCMYNPLSPFKICLFYFTLHVWIFLPAFRCMSVHHVHEVPAEAGRVCQII
ncbi:rCG27786 [Rattus norvegicus]|uniref:RCG27786 n=1 Tax=Rattus norvegicus TaxID=10116 RepID=A6KBV3_RAT|nr:rCG27786 [Rattus norvegicus]